VSATTATVPQRFHSGDTVAVVVSGGIVVLIACVAGDVFDETMALIIIVADVWCKNVRNH